MQYSIKKTLKSIEAELLSVSITYNSLATKYLFAILIFKRNKYYIK